MNVNYNELPFDERERMAREAIRSGEYQPTPEEFAVDISCERGSREYFQAYYYFNEIFRKFQKGAFCSPERMKILFPVAWEVCQDIDADARLEREALEREANERREEALKLGKIDRLSPPAGYNDGGLVWGCPLDWMKNLGIDEASVVVTRQVTTYREGDVVCFLQDDVVCISRLSYNRRANTCYVKVGKIRRFLTDLQVIGLAMGFRKLTDFLKDDSLSVLEMFTKDTPAVVQPLKKQRNKTLGTGRRQLVAAAA